MIYIENDSMNPYYNFALEYYLMNEFPGKEDFFLFWRTEPTLMIGNYQNTAAEINEHYAKEKNIHIVRRVSGGGTIYTDPGGWQFSFITKSKSAEAIDFKTYTAPIIQALAELGVTACFNNRNDLLIDGKKFSGNAQHRNQNGTLHHGSILFNTDLEELVRSITVSDDKIISKGIQSIRQRVTNIIDHMEKKMTALQFKEQMLKFLLRPADTSYTLRASDSSRVEQIEREKFKSWEWNYGSEPDFQITKSKRFAGGKLEVSLSLEKGRIQSCRINGDFFYLGDIQSLTEALLGVPYRPEEIRNALTRTSAAESFYLITLDELISCII